MRRVLASAIALVFLMGGPASAQWLKIPLAGTPRTPEGKADLGAPAPRTTEGRLDLSGIWGRPYDGTPVNNIATGVEVLFQPRADALYKARI